MKKTPSSFGRFAKLFGQIHWTSPPWLKEAQKRPALFWGGCIGFLVILIACFGAYSWYKNRPEPQWITAKLTLPKISEVTETELIPDTLTIDFGQQTKEFNPQAVAPIGAVSKEVTEGVSISPAIPGQWRWDSDSRLIFTPKADWPAGQTFTVHFAKNFFAPNLPINPLTYSFKTEPFNLKISDFIFYQDPVHPEIKKAIATVDFNYPVDTQSFEKHIHLVVQALKNNQLDLSAQKYSFTVRFDTFKRKAYIHSEELGLPKEPRYLDLLVEKGVSSSTGSDKTTTLASKNLYLPDEKSYFKLTQANASIVRNEQDKPEQVLTLETSIGVSEANMNKAVHVYLLPKNYPATQNQPEQKDYQWTSPGEVTKAILALSTPVTLTPIPAENNYAPLHSYRFKAEKAGFLYVTVDKGVQGFGNYPLAMNYHTIVRAPEIPKEIRFIHNGSLLALSAEKKISVLIRGLPAVKFEIARVLPDNVNQLITQTAGDFNNPFFTNQQFNQQNISEIFSEIRSFNTTDAATQQYTALDLAKYLATETNPNGPHGLFLLQATGWDQEQNVALDAKTAKLVLITDLGLLVKDNVNGTHDVFVQSITKGQPVANAKVAILGKNGLPLFTVVTDNQGHATFPDLRAYIEEKEPTVYLASLDNDVSFIPFAHFNRQLNYSRFDIGGLYSSSQELSQLSAYIFSDRGIYRPGDTAHFGMIVKQNYAKGAQADLPVQISIMDPRGTTVYENKVRLPETGFMSLDYKTTDFALTGPYTINLSLIKDDTVQGLLGSATFKVAEFLPDRLRIASHFSETAQEGWISPKGLTATVDLSNLYGTKAAHHKISAKILLSPKALYFDKFQDYTFTDPFIDPNKPPRVFTENLPDTETDEQGRAVFLLNLDQFEKATYELRFFAEGFEKEGGRSVATESKALVSPLNYFIGFKKDGDLGYIKQNAARGLRFIAIDKAMNSIAVEGLTVHIAARQPVSTLIKNANGAYQYQSIIKSTVLSTAPFAISKDATELALPTQNIGNFSVTIMDKAKTILAYTEFSVIGESQQPLAKNAELSAKLNKTEYKASEDIEMHITTPYTGAGLITIERDKVYAVQWFQTDAVSSVQKIHIPEDFQGDGYVNITFIRNWDSPEIFINPLSYTVLPFRLSHEDATLNIDLKAEQKLKPGDALTINYTTNKPSKLILFGIDEGILQVSRYLTPDPLSFFFQKHALEVMTQQTVDLILPKFIMERELSSVGGDGGEEALGSQLNPFKRKTDKPVAFWSGLIDAGSETKQYTYSIPEYFNGTLRIMAVAVSDNELGSIDTKALVQGDFIINPNVPTFVSPDDSFEVTVSVANNLKEASTEETEVSLNLPDALEALSPTKMTIQIPAGQEKTVRFTLRAKPLLGAASLGFQVRQGDKSSHLESSLSIRAASPMVTTLKTAKTDANTTEIVLDRVLYPNFRDVHLSLSTNPLVLALGLEYYLAHTPYGCTEQLVSKTFPLIALSKASWFDQDAQAIEHRVMQTIQMLKMRQTSSGAFAYWPGANLPHADNFATVYAMHFLTEAKAAGFAIPSNLFYNGLEYLKTLASQNTTELEKARVQAYAIYILTRNEIVTTNYVANLQLSLDQTQKGIWETDITGTYLAATYQLLQNQDEALRLMGLFKIPENTDVGDFYSPNLAKAQYLYLLAKHFPELLAKKGEQLLSSLIQVMNTDDLNTILSSYISLALSDYPIDKTAHNLELAVNEQSATGTILSSEKTDSDYSQLILSEKVQTIILTNQDKKTYFYQLAQTGFDKAEPKTVVNRGIEIHRDYYSLKGEKIQSTTLGSEIEVHIQLRAIDNRYLTNIAVVDLLPGGFEFVADSIKAPNIDYADPREDRVIFYTSLSPNTTEIIYKIKATNIGTYMVAAPFAESMYQKDLQGRGLGGQLLVTEGTNT